MNDVPLQTTHVDEYSLSVSNGRKHKFLYLKSFQLISIRDEQLAIQVHKYKATFALQFSKLGVGRQAILRRPIMNNLKKETLWTALHDRFTPDASWNHQHAIHPSRAERVLGHRDQCPGIPSLLDPR